MLQSNESARSVTFVGEEGNVDQLGSTESNNTSSLMINSASVNDVARSVTFATEDNVSYVEFDSVKVQQPTPKYSKRFRGGSAAGIRGSALENDDIAEFSGKGNGPMDPSIQSHPYFQNVFPNTVQSPISSGKSFERILLESDENYHRLSTTFEGDEYVTELNFGDGDAIRRKRRKHKKATNDKTSSDIGNTAIEISTGQEMNSNIFQQDMDKRAIRLSKVKQISKRLLNRRIKKHENHAPEPEIQLDNNNPYQDLTTLLYCQPVSTPKRKLIYYKLKRGSEKLDESGHVTATAHRPWRSPGSPGREMATPDNYFQPKEGLVSDPLRTSRLATPTQGKYEKKPEPPRYSTEYPLIPFETVDKLQEIRNRFATLPNTVEKLRFSVTANTAKGWRNVYNPPNEAFTQKRINLLEKKPGHVKIDLRKYHARMSDKSMVTPKDLAQFQYSEFSKKLSLGFVCVVLDNFMQVLGTYDCSLGTFIPGLQLSPPFLTQKIAKTKLNFSRANLLEIEFSKLPPETFAVVPVFMDESYLHPAHKNSLPVTPVASAECTDPTAISLNCDLFLKTNDPNYGRRASSGVVSDMSKEEAEKFLPQDFIMAQCDGVDDLWFKIANKRHNDGNLFVQRILRLIARRLKTRTVSSSDSFLTEEQLNPSPPAVEPEDPYNYRRQSILPVVHHPGCKSWWTHYCVFQIMRSFRCDPVVVKSVVTPNSVGLGPPPKPQTANRISFNNSSRRNSNGSLHSHSGSIPSTGNMIPIAATNAAAISGKRLEPVLPSHLATMNADIAPHPSTLKPKLHRNRIFQRPQAEVPDGQEIEGRADNSTFGLGDAFAPFILFRKSSPEPSWGLLPVLSKISNCQQRMDTICQHITELMVSRGLLPYHVVHIEHCVNCADHQLTTRHIPGHYDDHFLQLRNELKSKLPPALILSNISGVATNPPEIGSFEVSVRPYTTEKTSMVYSKISKGVFPTPVEIIEKLSEILLPETVHYKENCPSVDVCVIDGYSRRPLVGAVVTLCKAHTVIGMKSVPLENISAVVQGQYFASRLPTANPGYSKIFRSSSLGSIETEYNSEDEEKITSGRKDAEKSSLAIRRTITPADARGRSGKSLSSKGRDYSDNDRSASPSAKGSRKVVVQEPVKMAAMLAATKPKRSTSPSDASLRHSFGFAKVRAWSTLDVDNWMTQHGASPELLARAKVAGVVDGESLVKLLTAKNLESWGVRNRLQILKFIRGLAAICAGNNRELREVLSNCSVNMSFDQLASSLTTPSPSFVSAYLSPANHHVNMPGGNGYEVIPQHEGIRLHGSTSSPLEISVLTSVATDERGIAKFTCEYSGNYYLKISHPTSRDMQSHVFRIQNEFNAIHSIILKPKLALVMIVIRFSSIEELDAFPHYSFLTGLLNTKSGSRHIILSEYWSLEFDNNDFLFIGERWLPVGTYVCGVTGEVVTIDQPSREQNMAWRDSIPQYYELFPLDKTIFSFKASQAIRLHKNLVHRAMYYFHKLCRKTKLKQTINGVHRIVTTQSRIRRFVEHIRKKIRNRAAIIIQKRMMGIVMKLQFLRIRTRLIKIQAIWRGVAERQRIITAKSTGASFFVNALKLSRRSSIAVIQLRYISNRIAHKEFSKTDSSPSLILEAIRTRRWHATVVIQCAYRMHLHRLKMLRLIKIREARKVLLKFVAIFRRKMFQIKEVKKIFNRQCVEVLLMSTEEKYTRKLMKQEREIREYQKQIDRRILEDKARKLDVQRKVANQRRYEAAAVIQSLWRMHRAIFAYARRKQALAIIQKFARNASCMHRMIKEKKRQHLLRMHRRQSLINRRSIFSRNFFSSAGFSNRLKFAVNIGRNTFLGKSSWPVSTQGLMRKVLEKHVVRIQSVIRMRHARKRYLAKRRALGNRHVPLYRVLVPIPEDRSLAHIQELVNAAAVDEDDDSSTITDYSAIRRNNTMLGKLRKQGENLITIGSALTFRALNLKSELQQYVFKRKEARMRQHRELMEAQFSRRLNAIIKLQAAIRGMLCRQELYGKVEVRSTVKKLMFHSDDVNAEFTVAKHSLLAAAEAHARQMHSKTIQKQIEDSERDVPENESTIHADSMVDKATNQFTVENAVPIQTHQHDSTGSTVLGNERVRPSIAEGLSISIDRESSGLNQAGGSLSADEKKSSTQDGADRDKWSANISKSMSKVTSKLSTKLVDGVIATTNVLNAAKDKAIDATNEYLLRQRLTAEREFRRKHGQVLLTDALLNIRGTLVTDLPTIERKWYIKAFPKASYTQTGVEVDAVNESWRDLVPDLTESASESVVEAHVSNQTLSSQQQEAAKKLVSKPTPTEATQTITMSPFSLASLHDASFFVHLTDLTRYKSIEIVIFIENDIGLLGPKSSADGELVRDSVDGMPTGSDDGGSLLSGVKQEKRFLPVFYGECFLGRGSVFGPQGGRMSVKLVPNSFQVQRMPHGRRLQALGGIEFLVTLLPIAQPSSLFLRTFRNVHRQAPCYPSTLVTCELLQPTTINWDTFYGGAVCVAAFQGRLLVSTRRKGAPKGIAEFDNSGKLVCQAYEPYSNLGSIVLMISGMKHVVCCGSTGFVMIIRENRGEAPVKKHGATRYEWAEPLFIHAFEDSIAICGCALAHAGLDFFFIVGKNYELCVTILENGECFRCAINNKFLRSSIKSIAACAPYLYLATADGDLVVLNLQPVLDGDIEVVGYLHRLIVRQETIFSSNAGISSMAVMAPNAFLGLKCEDEYRKELIKRSKYLANPKDDKYQHEYVEGHLLIIGGNDAMPVVKVMHPLPGGMKEVVSLTGHLQAITSICADAAGRYIVSASAGERRILIWDGLTFTCERLIDDVNVGSICLGEDCLLVSSHKAPFLRLWSVPPASTKPRVQDKHVDSQEMKCRQIENECGIRYTDIPTTRLSEWCYAMLKGGFKPKKSCGQPPYLDPLYVQVLWRWAHQYHGSRLDAPEVNIHHRKRTMERMQRVKSVPGTPLAIRKGETPRTRARRRYEKDQMKLLSDLSDVSGALGSPMNPEALETDKFASPIRSRLGSFLNAVEEEPFNYNDSTKGDGIDFEDDSLVHSPVGEDDPASGIGNVYSSPFGTPIDTPSAGLGSNSDSCRAYGKLAAFLNSKTTPRPVDEDDDDDDDEDGEEDDNKDGRKGQQKCKPVNDDDDDDDDEVILTAEQIKQNRLLSVRPSDIIKKSNLAQKTLSKVPESPLQLPPISDKATLNKSVGKQERQKRQPQASGAGVQFKLPSNSTSSQNTNEQDPGNELDEDDDNKSVPLTSTSLYVPARFKLRLKNLSTADSEEQRYPGKKQRYRPQFGNEHDESDDEKEIQCQLQRKKSEYILKEKEIAREEKRKTLRPRVIQHMNDIDEGD